MALGGKTWSNKTESAAGASSSVSALPQSGMTRPRKRRTAKALNTRTYKYQSLDSGISGEGASGA